jgi:hypothetical protein
MTEDTEATKSDVITARQSAQQQRRAREQAEAAEIRPRHEWISLEIIKILRKNYVSTAREFSWILEDVRRDYVRKECSRPKSTDRVQRCRRRKHVASVQALNDRYQEMIRNGGPQ